MAEISQRLTYCPNGHMYDANKHASCPICASTVSGTTDVVGGDIGETRDVPDNAGLGGVGVTTVPGTTPVNGNGDFGPTTTVTPPGMGVSSVKPVVGWLVAVSGPNLGKDYRIHAGYNFIGRERGDICIGGDMAISAQKDSNITYVYQTNKFYIAHESGANVLLVNDIPAIGNATELHNYDRITIGSTSLLFLGLCGEQFSWSEKKENQNV